MKIIARACYDLGLRGRVRVRIEESSTTITPGDARRLAAALLLQADRAERAGRVQVHYGVVAVLAGGSAP